MNDSPLLTTALPIALAIIMFGLGLTLSVDDFRRIAREPRAVTVALVLQVVALPVTAFLLIEAFDLDPLLAVGVMLLAASPGGTTANLFSHLFGGDVALNVTLTAINSVLAAITVPLIANFSISHFGADGELGLQLAKVLQVIAIVLVPVVLGMAVRRRSPDLAARADRPVRTFSIVVLAAVALGALLSEREHLMDYLADVGFVTGLFCLVSLSLGYAVARLLRLGDRQAVACAMEVGIHNTSVAMTIGLSVLNNNEVAVPAAVYSVLMYIIATAFGFAISAGTRGGAHGGTRGDRADSSLAGAGEAPHA